MFADPAHGTGAGLVIAGKIGLYQREKGADRLVYLSAEARADGVQAGLSVADARARHPDMRFAPVDHNADQALLTALHDGRSGTALLLVLMPTVWGFGLRQQGPAICLPTLQIFVIQTLMIRIVG